MILVVCLAIIESDEITHCFVLLGVQFSAFLLEKVNLYPAKTISRGFIAARYTLLALK